MTIANPAGSLAATPTYKPSRKEAARLRAEQRDRKEQEARAALSVSVRVQTICQAVLDGSFVWDDPDRITSGKLSELLAGLTVSGRRDILRACKLSTVGKVPEQCQRFAAWFDRRGRSLLEVVQDKIAAGVQPSAVELKVLTLAVLKAACAKVCIKVTGYNREDLASMLCQHAKGTLDKDCYRKVKAVAPEVEAAKSRKAEAERERFLAFAVEQGHATDADAAVKLWQDYQRLQALKAAAKKIPNIYS